MSILIKDMEMPQACWECPLKFHLFQQLWCVLNNKVINREDNTEREPYCPLVEVNLVAQEELITPLNMIGGYLEKVKENENENHNV